MQTVCFYYILQQLSPPLVFLRPNVIYQSVCQLHLDPEKYYDCLLDVVALPVRIHKSKIGYSALVICKNDNLNDSY